MQAIALGADGVFVGRPIIFALAISGQEGVERALNLLKKEFKLSLMLLGCASPADLQRSHIVAPGDSLSKL